MAAVGMPETNVSDLSRELGIARSIPYRHVSPASPTFCNDGSRARRGEKLEWRGQRRDQKFKPATAILRLIEKTSDKSYASVLVILRVEVG
jgi:hypothetical protein